MKALPAAALLAAITFAAPALRAQTSAVAHLDAETAAWVSIADTQEAWAAFDRSPAKPLVYALLAQAGFDPEGKELAGQLATIEAALGFSLGGASLAQVITSLDIALLSGERGSENVFLVLAKVGDEVKFSRLMDLVEKSAEQAFGDGAASEEETTGPIRKLGDGAACYARASDWALLATSEGALQELLGRIDNPTTASGLAVSTDFASISAQLAGRTNHIFFYMDDKAINELPGNLNVQKLGRDLDRLIPSTARGGIVHFDGASVFVTAYTPLDAQTAQSPMYRGYFANRPAGPLSVFNFAPERTMLAAATNILDTSALRQAASGAGSASGLGGFAIDGDALQEMAGVSFDKDILPILGNEAGLFINSVRLDPAAPKVDLLIAIGHKDQAKMAAIVKRLGSEMAKTMGEEGATAVQTTKHAGTDILTVDLRPLVPLEIALAASPQFLMAAASRDTIINALDAQNSGSGLAGSAGFTALGPRVTAAANFVGYLRIDGIMAAIREAAKLGGAPLNIPRAVDTALRRIEAVAWSVTAEGQGLLSESVLLLKP